MTETVFDSCPVCGAPFSGANSFEHAPTPGWQDISTAPELERVIVAGWQPATKRVEGYWWMHEDVIVNGKPDSFPDALLWHPFPTRPALSPPPPPPPM